MFLKDKAALSEHHFGEFEEGIFAPYSTTALVPVWFYEGLN